MTESPGGVAVTLVRPDGRETTLSVRSGETVLEAAERVEVGIPFGCLRGACGTCTGRLLSADVSAADDRVVADGDPGDASLPADAVFEFRRPARALKARHERAGYVLLCVAEPLVPCRIRVGASVQAELVARTWMSAPPER